MNLFITKKKEITDFKFCENQKLIKRKLLSLTPCKIQVDALDGKLYIDKETGQKWEVYEHDDFETYREPYLKGIRCFPHPSLTEIITIVCCSQYKDEIKGACRLLLENEELGTEFRELLLNEIEKRRINKNKKRYKWIFNAANLNNQTNMRDPLHKKMNEINADYSYYLSLADRAKKLKR